MSKLVKFIKKNAFILAIMAIALFFYLFRLQDTFVMAGDTSRDLIDIMHIWQGKIITVVGEPVNTISDNPTQVLFPSLYLYLGLIGLLVTNFNPVGSVLMDVVLTIASIPFFYLLAQKLLNNKKWAQVSTVIYALSPVTVALARSFWEPNIVIPISVFAWFFFLYKKSFKNIFIAGFITGIVFDIHYMNVFPLAIYILTLIFQKKMKDFWLASFGFLIAVSPLLVFELRNHFYLFKALMGTFSGFSTFSDRSVNPFISMDSILHIFGLAPYQYFLPSLVEISHTLRLILGTVVGLSFIYFLIKRKKSFPLAITVAIMATFVESWYFGKFGLIGIRYVLSALPILIISFAFFVSQIAGYIVFLLIIPMILLSTKIITHKLDASLREDYYPVSYVEEISKAIVADAPGGNYNVTENILGDARSLAFRFYLLRDAAIKPQPVETYDKIDTLYVISPSFEKIYQESRWEFNASGPKDVAWEKDFGELKLFKFVR